MDIAMRGQGEAEAAAGGGDQALIAALRDHLARSLLPGEDRMSAGQLDEAAAFVLEAARERRAGEPALLIRSAHAGRRFTRFAIINPDMPFLVDSIAAAIAAEGLAIDLLAHPVVPVRRDADGRLTAIPQDEVAGEKRESIVYLETARIEARVRRSLEQQLLRILADVRAAVTDWPAMQALLMEDADRLPDPEGAALLRWLGSGMMTQLGHLTRRRDGAQAQVLGICREGERELLAEDTVGRAFAWFDGSSGPQGAPPGRAPLIVKANRTARVHRRVPLDLFIVPVIEEGRVAALSIHAGIWTSAALGTPPDRVPILRRQLATIRERLGVPQDGHDAKALVHALTVLPHDLVIGFSDADIARVATTMMALVNRPRPRLAMVVAPLQRHVFAFVWLPRDLVSTAIRQRIRALLESETGALTLDWSLLVEGGALAMLRFVLDFRGREHQPDEAAIDARLQAMLRGWSDAVEEALAATEEPGRAAALATRYAELFPDAYRSAYGAGEAAKDIARMRHLGTADPLRPLCRDARLYRHDQDGPERLRLKIYQLGGAMPLSDAVPALENFGFRVLAEMPTELAGPDAGTIHDFQLCLPGGEDVAALLARSAPIEQAIVAVINGRAEDDAFNRLVTATDLVAGEADWLRALYRYLRQTSIAFTIATVVDALRAAPAVTRALVDLFRHRHDPAFAGDREAAAAEAEQRIASGLAQVAAINDDRLLRLYWATIGAVVRTNAFTPAAEEALALKLDSARVPQLPRPVPWREIFVYSRRLEGIHLRAGPVARGGLRWSDRRDDFRTEVLGLMKAQRVKNAVIVPTGAKGGFYPKRLPNPALDRDAWFAEGTESYRLFVRTLLSVTDNIVDGAVVHPSGVVVHDGPDPYFVVAADKGTASFSDIANAIALERGFWLGDAFASGGSNGYDHKAMAITARGAWISVQRHFLEMGVDVQADPVRVAGCGDMSGDVFGNGMLLSKAIRLVAAFDHRHIFLDPDPDPEASWAERRRLFDLPRSSWADYSPGLLSKGGGIYPRTLKRIPLSAEARAMLGIEEEALDPDSLIAAILRSPVDLLWFGGIGTYIKAASQSHADVGDPANDAVRVDAGEVRARVIGEGANLAVTQAGRIAFALGGGRINTDFIDNSAGVDCSDNEVNIKIALAAALRSGELTEARRNALLAEMTEEVAALVLEDNRLQALALSIAERGGAGAVASQTRLIETLEDRGQLDRRTEGLASGEELGRRAAEGRGLTRPELAVLLSTTKLVLQEALEDSGIAADPAAEPLLLSDFPARMHEAFREPILGHRLRPQIVATVIANRIVNRMGMVHPFELAEEEGASLAQVGAAFVGACELVGIEAIWQAIDATAMPEQARLALFDQAALALRGHMADLLRTGGGAMAPSRLVNGLAPAVARLIDRVDDLLAAQARLHAEAIARTLVETGAPQDLAERVARLFALDGAIGLAQLAHDSGVDPVRLTNAFISLGERLGLDWAQSRAAIMNPSDPWERLLVAGLARDFQQMRLEFLRRLGPAEGDDSHDPLTLIERWIAGHDLAIEHLRAMITRAQAAPALAPTMLAQIASQARNLLQR
ncbi:MAG: NAD-glutamate dehydrogenase [Porphyrobacter sp.]|nr:NAD-glutamate dehydrogenase [Porphyrobacter sp.]